MAPVLTEWVLVSQEADLAAEGPPASLARVQGLGGRYARGPQWGGS